MEELLVVLFIVVVIIVINILLLRWLLQTNQRLIEMRKQTKLAEKQLTQATETQALLRLHLARTDDMYAAIMAKLPPNTYTPQQVSALRKENG